jgi:hypothetical protein
MAGGGGVRDGEGEIRIAEDRVYFLSTDLGGDIVRAKEDHGDGDGGCISKTGLSPRETPIRATTRY